jgi:hypothetical protein
MTEHTDAFLCVCRSLLSPVGLRASGFSKSKSSRESKSILGGLTSIVALNVTKSLNRGRPVTTSVPVSFLTPPSSSVSVTFVSSMSAIRMPFSAAAHRGGFASQTFNRRVLVLQL